MIYQEVGYNSAVTGILLGSVENGICYIRKNRIYNLKTTSNLIRGIYANNPASGSVFNIENNMIALVDSVPAVQIITGIEFAGSSAYTLNIFYNSLLIGGLHSGGTAGATTSASIRTTAPGITLNMKNNIVVNNRTGGNVNHIGFALVSQVIPNNLDINYNCYFANSSANSYAAFWLTTGYNTLSTYKAAVIPQEQNTIFKEVFFASPNDLHLVSTSVGDFELAGIPIPNITTDFDGEPRDLFLPYRGADESTTLPVELVSFGAVVDGGNVMLNWTTATETNNLGFEVLRKDLNTDWKKIGFVSGFGTTTEPRYYSFYDNTFGASSYKYKLKQLDFDGTFTFSKEINVEVNLPAVFSLEQNYPNPFNPNTVISYRLPISSNITLKIFDILGNEVATLVDDFKEAGYHSVEFNATGLSSGVYFYSIKTDGAYEVKKMTLIK